MGKSMEPIHLTLPKQNDLCDKKRNDGTLQTKRPMRQEMGDDYSKLFIERQRLYIVGKIMDPIHLTLPHEKQPM